MKRIWHRLPKWLRIGLLVLVGLVSLAIAGIAWGWWYLNPTVERTNGVVYGQRHGKDLTLDVLQPEHPNGYGIALIFSAFTKVSR